MYGYEALEAHVARCLPQGQPLAILAESFSGPWRCASRRSGIPAP